MLQLQLNSVAQNVYLRRYTYPPGTQYSDVMQPSPMMYCAWRWRERWHHLCLPQLALFLYLGLGLWFVLSVLALWLKPEWF